MKKVYFTFRISDKKNELLLDRLGNQEKLGQAIRKKILETDLKSIDFTEYEPGNYKKRVLVSQEEKQRLEEYFNNNRKSVGKACSIIFNRLLKEVVANSK